MTGKGYKIGLVHDSVKLELSIQKREFLPVILKTHFPGNLNASPLFSRWHNCKSASLKVNGFGYSSITVSKKKKEKKRERKGGCGDRAPIYSAMLLTYSGAI